MTLADELRAIAAGIASDEAISDEAAEVISLMADAAALRDSSGPGSIDFMTPPKGEGVAAEDSFTPPDRAASRDEALRDRILQIGGWWEEYDAAQRELAMEKAQEYDGLDLEIMGKAMEGLLPPGLDSRTRTQAGLEMAVAFYELGKISRMFASYRQGTIPRSDNWDDLRIYATMGKCIRDTGRWT